MSACPPDDPGSTLRLSDSTLGTASGAGAILLCYYRGGLERVRLAPDEAWVVGRGADCELMLDDPSLSRNHALLRFDGEALQVEDLESTNGLRQGPSRVSRARLRAGESVRLGRVSLVLHGVSSGAPAMPPGLESHERFMQRMDEELQRTHDLGRGFALVQIATEAPRTLADQWPAIAAHLRPSERAGVYSERTVELLLPEATSGRIEQLAQALPRVRLGAAMAPEHGRSADALLAAARDALAEANQSVRLRFAGDAVKPAAAAPVRSEAGSRVYAEAEQLARHDLPMLILGETGVGKEVLARHVHARSRRAKGRFVALNCGALPATLVESMLFGHERGAFTGADRCRPGVFEQADGGTLLLDELGELPLAAQASLLRVLEEGEVCRLGGHTPHPVDVRVIATTHRDIEAMCVEGTFREDLWFRLNTLTLRLPPLRERPQDLRALADFLLAQANASLGSELRFDPTALQCLMSHHWPGNVRELRNEIHRAAVLADGPCLVATDFSERVRQAEQPRAVSGISELRARLREYEAKLLQEALERTGWNQSEAARQLCMPRRTLVHKMRVLGVRPPASHREAARR